jgi:hypothetical protein
MDSEWAIDKGACLEAFNKFSPEEQEQIKTMAGEFEKMLIPAITTGNGTVQYDHTQEWLADNVRLRQENARLRDTIRDLLLSADCTWEEKNEGHDWATACEMARKALKEAE